MTVRLSELEALLREAGICDSLVEAVEALTGPLIDARAERQAADEAWAAVFRAEDDARTRPWLEDLRAAGLLRRLSENDLGVARALLRHAYAIEKRLPASALPLAWRASRERRHAFYWGASPRQAPASPTTATSTGLASTSATS